MRAVKDIFFQYLFVMVKNFTFNLQSNSVMKNFILLCCFVVGFLQAGGAYSSEKGDEFISDLNVLFEEQRYIEVLDMALFYEKEEPFLLTDISRSNVLFMKGIALAGLKKYDESISVLEIINDSHISNARKVMKLEVLGINYLTLGKSEDAYSRFNMVIDDFDVSSTGGLRKKVVYLSVLVRLASELHGFQPAESFVNRIEALRDKCESVGHTSYCDAVYFSSYGKLYADHAMSGKAKVALQKAINLFEQNIAGYRNNPNYKDVIEYHNNLYK